MISSLLSEPPNTILENRLQRLAATITSNAALFNLTTIEDYTAEIYSAVNNVLTLADLVTPLSPIPQGQTSLVSDWAKPLTYLNQDIADTVSYLESVENTITLLANLSSASASTVKQKIRDLANYSTSSSWIVALSKPSIYSSLNCNLNTKVGRLTLPITSNILLTPTLSLGSLSSGVANIPVSSWNQVPLNPLQWDGEVLQLVLTFPTPMPIINHLEITSGGTPFSLVGCVASPDGIGGVNILASIGKTSIVCGPSNVQNPNSLVLDFPPQYVQTLTLTFNNLNYPENLVLGNLTTNSIQYSSSGIATIPAPLISEVGPFYVKSFVPTPYTNLLHFVSTISGDTIITPGIPVTFPNTNWSYKVAMSVSPAAFTATASSGSNPVLSPNYSLSSSGLVQLGNGLAQRTNIFTNITGAITFVDVPITGSLVLTTSNGTLIPSSQWTFSSNILTITSPPASVTVTYQITLTNSANLSILQPYYTPWLDYVSF